MFHYYNFFFLLQFYHNCEIDCFYIFDQIMARILLSFTYLLLQLLLLLILA